VCGVLSQVAAQIEFQPADAGQVRAGQDVGQLLRELFQSHADQRRAAEHAACLLEQLRDGRFEVAEEAAIEAMAQAADPGGEAGQPALAVVAEQLRLAVSQLVAVRRVGRQRGEFALQANERRAVASGLVAVLLQPVGVDQAGRVVVGAVDDAPEQCRLVHHVSVASVRKSYQQGWHCPGGVSNGRLRGRIAAARSAGRSKP
jgi:hypothetical protein